MNAKPVCVATLTLLLLPATGTAEAPPTPALGEVLRDALHTVLDALPNTCVPVVSGSVLGIDSPCAATSGTVGCLKRMLGNWTETLPMDPIGDLGGCVQEPASICIRFLLADDRGFDLKEYPPYVRTAGHYQGYGFVAHVPTGETSLHGPAGAGAYIFSTRVGPMGQDC
ncbi:MAG: hypothetical protein V4510_07590 [bacterium]